MWPGFPRGQGTPPGKSRVSAPPDNPTIHAALYNATTGRPNRPAIESLFQAISAAINTVTGGGGGGVWGAITGTLSSQTDLQTALNGKAASTHTHTLAAITDAGTAAGKAAPASGDATATQVVLGSDTRLTNARAPTTHTHAESDVTNLVADLATAKQLPISGHIEAPAAKTYVLDEAAQAGGTIVGITHRCPTGSVTFSIQIAGVNVTGLAALTSGATQAAVTATGANTYTAGQRITLLVTAVSTPAAPADFAWTLRRTSA